MSDFPYTPEQLAWLEALESGKYKQGQSQLRYGDKFCCLGVACELIGMEAQKIDGQYWYEDWYEVAPAKVVSTLHLRGECGSTRSNRRHLDLTELNDSGHSFAEIAAIIRASPSEYFTNLDGENANG